jgi:hypothetical protein
MGSAPKTVMMWIRLCDLEMTMLWKLPMCVEGHRCPSVRLVLEGKRVSHVGCVQRLYLGIVGVLSRYMIDCSHLIGGLIHFCGDTFGCSLSLLSVPSENYDVTPKGGHTISLP